MTSDARERRTPQVMGIDPYTGLPAVRRKPPDTIAERIALALDFRRMSMRDLAKKTGMSVSLISRGCSGKNMTAATLLGIADGLGVTTDWLLGRKGAKP